MKRIVLAALVLPVFLVGCGEPAPDPTYDGYEAPVVEEPVVTETEVGSDVLVIDMDWDTVRVIRQRVHGVDCVITTNSDNIATTCDWGDKDATE